MLEDDGFVNPPEAATPLGQATPATAAASCESPPSSATAGAAAAPVVRRVAFRHQALALETRWGVGIGGDIWTTGTLLCGVLERHHAFFQRLFKGRRILELGSGTGLVGLCIASAGSGFAPAEVVVTDREDHLDLIRRNARANGLRPHDHAGIPAEDGVDGNGNGNAGPAARETTKLAVCEFDWLKEDVAHLGPLPFDVILGTDVAYCEELYAPVVQALRAVSGPTSVILLGVTRTDTGPAFFQLLHEHGFDYCLLPRDVGEIDGGNGGGGGAASGFALISITRRVT